MKRIIFIILLFFAYNSTGLVFAQNPDTPNDPEIDSLQLVLKKQTEQDQIATLNELASKYTKYSNQKVQEYALKALTLSQKYNNKKEEGKAYYFIGFAFLNDANYENALENYQYAVNIYTELNDMTTVARIYSDIGVVYKKWGQYDKAIEAYQNAMKIQDSNNDLRGKATTLSLIGNVYFFWGESYYEKALETYIEAAKICKEIDYIYGVVSNKVNIGLIYIQRKQIEKALEYYHEAEELCNTHSFKPGLYNVYLSMSEAYGVKKEYQKALEYTQKALELAEEIHYDRDMPAIFKGMGELYQEWGKTDKNTQKFYKALDLYKQSVDLYVARNQLKEASDLYLAISDVNADLGDFKSAFENHKQHKKLNDSIFNSDMHKTIEEMEAKYESEKKDLEISSQKKEIHRQNQLRNVLIGGFIIVFIFSIALYKQFSDKKKANVLLETQNDMLEEQNDLLEKRSNEIKRQHDEIKRQHDKISEQKQAIEDSIHYASRIQSAVLPNFELIHHVLPEHFILFKPRDIVSGDFYWLTHKEGKTIVVAADCTGHGVPGAFMSMLGVSFLNEIVNKKEMLFANQILDELRNKVMTSLHQTGKENEAKDGMDIALCIVDIPKKELQFAGAYNPLVFIRDNTVEQISADKMPIGIYYAKQKPFTNNVLEVKTGDCMYIFSDGYVDQFGGTEGKKYLTRKFKQRLLEIHQHPMEEQKTILNNDIESWKNELSQTDDILVIGFRI